MKTVFSGPSQSLNQIESSKRVYCPNCGSFQGTVGGLNVQSEWRKCAPSCPSLIKDGEELLETGGGHEFPVCYSCDHVHKHPPIIEKLRQMGYVKVEEIEVPGVGMNQSLLPAEKMAPKILKADHTPTKGINHAMRQQNAHTLFGPVKDFLNFATKNHPQYLEIKEGGETHFLQYTPTVTTKKKLRQRILSYIN